MRLEIHVHSCFSDGVPTPKEIVEHSKKIGLGGVAVTDHDSIEGGLEALKYGGKDFMVIAGVEVSSLEGHILALGVREHVEVRMPAKKTVEKIHELGGVAVAAHPYDRYRRGVGDLIHELDFDAVEVVNAHTFTNWKNPRMEAEKAGLPAVGGTDAHCLAEIGNITIEVEENPLESIKKGKVKIIQASKPKMLAGHARSFVERLMK